MRSQIAMAMALSFALLGLSAVQADANYYSGWTKSGTEIRIHPNSKSRVKDKPGAGKWMIFSYCRGNWCYLSDRNLYWGWIKKSHLRNLKICPEPVCGDGIGRWKP